MIVIETLIICLNSYIRFQLKSEMVLSNFNVTIYVQSMNKLHFFIQNLKLYN